MNANIISAERAMETGPACSLCNAKVNKIWPPKLKKANRKSRNQSSEVGGRANSPMATVTVKVCMKAKKPKDA